jgi:N-acyl-D-amino-acid deacylase
LDIRANQYPYVAGGTALASSLPPWLADGGVSKLLERLRDANVRSRIKSEMATDHADWENLFHDCGGGAGILIAGVVNPELKKYNGKTIAEMARMENKDELNALFDFVLSDNAQTGALYFMASEDDLTYGLKQPWTSIGLDASESPLDGPLYEPQSHPRAFGSMPRFLGRYVREQKLMPLTEAIRKITSMPAQRQRLVGRGQIQVGYFADITIFDADTITDQATYTESTKLSQGIEKVLVNGQVEFEHGALTGVNAGRALRGPGWAN